MTQRDFVSTGLKINRENQLAAFFSTDTRHRDSFSDGLHSHGKRQHIVRIRQERKNAARSRRVSTGNAYRYCAGGDASSDVDNSHRVRDVDEFRLSFGVAARYRPGAHQIRSSDGHFDRISRVLRAIEGIAGAMLVRAWPSLVADLQPIRYHLWRCHSRLMLFDGC